MAESALVLNWEAGQALNVDIQRELGLIPGSQESQGEGWSEEGLPTKVQCPARLPGILPVRLDPGLAQE